MKRSALRISVIVIALVLIGASFFVRTSADARLRSAEKTAVAESAAAAAITRQHHDVVSEIKVRPGTNFTELLLSANVDSESARRITEVVRPVFKPRSLKAGQKLVFTHRFDGVLKSIQYRTGWDSELQIANLGPDFTATEKKLEAKTETVVVKGTLESSLFESVLDLGETPELAVRLAEIFAFDLDFYSDPQPGDTFKLVFEKRTVPGDDSPTYGRIFAAEYVNGTHPYTAVLFREPNGHPAYYTAEGKSLQKAFLKSPLKFAARVSSHFSRRRFHPVAHVYRPHYGTDYAVGVGTPVQAIANGRIAFSGYKGANGNLIVIKHNNGYESYYLHLSRRFVRNGQNVQQGQRIGLTGMTGLASGPHLDFRLKRGSAFVDFERLKLPPANPVDKHDLPAFYAERDKWMPMLQAPGVLETHQAKNVEPAKPASAD
ncbi:MAG TPA: M23 family metallopeptidase [Terriglobales bacterium]|nr:M23 family metallopeptidase [Terriglobales bacterium]